MELIISSFTRTDYLTSSLCMFLVEFSDRPVYWTRTGWLCVGLHGFLFPGGGALPEDCLWHHDQLLGWHSSPGSVSGHHRTVLHWVGARLAPRLYSRQNQCHYGY